MLTVNNVSKNYGKSEILKNINIQFENGVYGILAPNGAGKTTLLKMIATLIMPSDGEILWQGTDIKALDEQYRDIIGYLPQKFGYYRNWTPIQYLTYLAALKGMAENTKQRVQQVISLVALDEVANKKMKKFSGGMIQRVGIAQALLNEPKILILDEPTAGLDPKERVRLRNIISHISKNCIILFSTHIVSDIESIANKIIMIKDKSIIFNDTPNNICSTLNGQVFEKNINDDEYEIFFENHIVLSQRQDGNIIKVRFFANEGNDSESEAVSPTLEDVFLYTYNEVLTKNQ